MALQGHFTHTPIVAISLTQCHDIFVQIRWKIADLISATKVEVKVKCAELNQHDATVNSIPQEETMMLCLWDVLKEKRIKIKEELRGPLLAGLRANKDLMAIMPGNLFPDKINDDAGLYSWMCSKFAAPEWKTFTNLMMKQGVMHCVSRVYKPVSHACEQTH
jgi:hypothetical protein